MDEGIAYKWARQALRPFEGRRNEAHLYQQAADLVTSAILEAFVNGQLTSQSVQRIQKAELLKIRYENSIT